MIDFETLMFVIAFAPIVLIVIFIEIFLRIIFREKKNEDSRVVHETSNTSSV